MFTHYEVDNVVVIDLDYDLTEESASGFSEDMLSLIKIGKNQFVLKLDKVMRMTSRGLSALCRLSYRLESKGGWIRLAEVAPDMLEILAITRLADTFEIFETVDEAVSPD